MILNNSWQWLNVEETTSTNDLAKNHNIPPEAKALIITAKRQTAGRGRRGRQWISHTGNLFFSQLISTDIDISKLTFITSVSIAETLSDLTNGLTIGIKWPNDVLVNNKKICGILIEQADNGNVIIGVGVNLKSHPDNRDIIYPTTDLASLGFSISCKDFLQNYLSKFDNNMNICQQDFALIRQKWLEHALYINSLIKVSLKDIVEEGIFKGIDEQGLLLLETNSSIKKIAAGDVFL